MSAAAGGAQSKAPDLKDRLALQNREAATSPETPSARGKQPVATVAGETIYDDDLAPRAQGQLLPLRRQEYEIKKRVLDSLIEEKLLEAEAKKKGIPKEKLLEQEVDAKVQQPTDAVLQAYYLGQKDRLNRPFEEVKDQLRRGTETGEKPAGSPGLLEGAAGKRHCGCPAHPA